MGGTGSGRRWHYGAKDTTEDSLPLDIRKLRRAGVLIHGRQFGWEWTVNDRPVASIRVRVEAQRVVLLYRYKNRGDEWQDVVQPVYVDHTPCAYGGMRPWWFCPTCGRRVAILYGPGKFFACRHCYTLAYVSQRETADDRAARRADRIREKLGWEPGILNGKAWKPKGMHWRTFERLTAEHDAFVQISLAGIAQRFGMKF